MKLRWFGRVIRSSGLCKKVRTRHNTREKKTRKAKCKMGRQQQRVDRSRFQQQSEINRRPSEMAQDCRRFQQWCPYDPDGSGTQVTGKLKKIVIMHFHHNIIYSRPKCYMMYTCIIMLVHNYM